MLSTYPDSLNLLAPNLATLGLITVALHLLALLSFAATLIAVSLIDFKHYRIPDQVLLPGTMICALALLAASFAKDDWARFQQALLGATLGSAIYLVLHLAAKGGIGFGDVKLAGLIGLMTGWHSPGAAVTAPVLAFVGAGIVSLGLLLTRKINRSEPIPLAPFMALAAVAALSGTVYHGLGELG